MSQSPPDLRIRPVGPDDLALLLTLIRELAEYERLTDEVVATEEILRESMFGTRPAAEALITYLGPEPVCYAIWFYTFSSFLGLPGLYLEDVYVRPAARGRGIGQAIMIHLACMAKERNCGRMEWAVLDWNESTVAFYKNLGARPMEEWTTFGLTRRGLEHLAEQAD